MKILHTSDWHLGQNFMSHDRRDEHKLFLQWLIELVKEQDVDALVIAGDIFDTGTPPNYAEEIYFQFLADICHYCQHIIVVGGNHDSVSTLHAPKNVLKAIKTDVVGCRSEDPNDDIVEVHNATGDVIGFICCVPFLRERDLRSSVAGESYEDKSRAVIDGTKKHYGSIYDAAVKKREELGDKSLPIVATGHLYASGCTTSDGVRDIYVGNLGQIGADAFCDGFDYVALGHLHKPQRVGGKDNIRYSGSPIPLSFSEAKTEKQVIVVELADEPVIKTVAVPEFRKLRVVKGDLSAIEQGINDLDFADDETIWLEVHYDAESNVTNLESKVEALIVDKPVELFAVKNIRRAVRRQLSQDEDIEHLDDMSVLDVFEQKLDADEIADDERDELMHAFNDILAEVSAAREDR